MDQSRYRKLHKDFLVIMLLLLILILIMLICQYELVIDIDLRFAGIPKDYYMQTYVAIPMAIMFIAYIVLWRVLDSPNIDMQWKDFGTILYLWLVCTVCCFVVAEATILFGVYIVPITLSTMYGRKWMLRTTETLCLLTLAVLVGLMPLMPTSPDSLAVDILTAVVILVLCCFFNEIVMDFVLENNGLIALHVDDNTRLTRKLQRDPMTGLYNHTAFYEYLDSFVRNRGEDPLTLAVVDIDNFKKVNDTYGHNNGDEVILNLSRVLQRVCGDENYVCRYGGEEFSVIFPGMKVKQADEIMNRALAEFREIGYPWLDGHITFSCGIFQMSSYTMSAEEFFRVADKMLYQAKSNGKNRCVSG